MPSFLSQLAFEPEYCSLLVVSQCCSSIRQPDAGTVSNMVDPVSMSNSGAKALASIFLISFLMMNYGSGSYCFPVFNRLSLIYQASVMRGLLVVWWNLLLRNTFVLPYPWVFFWLQFETICRATVLIRTLFQLPFRSCSPIFSYRLCQSSGPTTALSQAQYFLSFSFIFAFFLVLVLWCQWRFISVPGGQGHVFGRKAGKPWFLRVM